MLVGIQAETAKDREVQRKTVGSAAWNRGETWDTMGARGDSGGKPRNAVGNHRKTWGLPRDNTVNRGRPRVPVEIPAGTHG